MKKYIYIIGSIVVLCFALMWPKPLFKNVESIEFISITYEGEKIDMSSDVVISVIELLSSVRKKTFLGSINNYSLVDTYEIRIIYNRKSYNIVVQADNMWGYSKFAFQITTDIDLYSHIKRLLS